MYALVRLLLGITSFISASTAMENSRKSGYLVKEAIEAAYTPHLPQTPRNSIDWYGTYLTGALASLKHHLPLSTPEILQRAPDDMRASLQGYIDLIEGHGKLETAAQKLQQHQTESIKKDSPTSNLLSMLHNMTINKPLESHGKLDKAAQKPQPHEPESTETDPHKLKIFSFFYDITHAKSLELPSKKAGIFINALVEGKITLTRHQEELVNTILPKMLKTTLQHMENYNCYLLLFNAKIPDMPERAFESIIELHKIAKTADTTGLNNKIKKLTESLLECNFEKDKESDQSIFPTKTLTDVYRDINLLIQATHYNFIYFFLKQKLKQLKRASLNQLWDETIHSKLAPPLQDLLGQHNWPSVTQEMWVKKISEMSTKK